MHIILILGGIFHLLLPLAGKGTNNVLKSFAVLVGIKDQKEGKLKKFKAIYGLLSLSFLIVGICIYLLFRNLDNLLLFAWAPKLEFVGGVVIQLPPPIFSYVLKYNLAGMFWFLSGILFFWFIWFHRIKMQRIYIGCFYGAGTIPEVSQLSERIPGTFDLWDLFFMGIGASAEGLLYNKFMKRKIA